MIRALGGCLTVVLALILSAAVYSCIGWVSAWVLLQLGLHVSWFVCAVAIWSVAVIYQTIFK